MVIKFSSSLNVQFLFGSLKKKAVHVICLCFAIFSSCCLTHLSSGWGVRRYTPGCNHRSVCRLVSVSASPSPLTGSVRRSYRQQRPIQHGIQRRPVFADHCRYVPAVQLQRQDIPDSPEQRGDTGGAAGGPPGLTPPPAQQSSPWHR